MRLLEFGEALVVASMVRELQDDAGFSTEEFLPGLIQAVVEISRDHKYEEQLLDESADLLADGGIGDGD